MDFLSFLPDSAMGWVNAGALLVACSSGVAAAISKLTKNKADDKIAGWLKKAHDLLAGVGLHGHSLAEKRAVPVVFPPGTRDHRSK
jgi:hypothetical protein